MKTALAFIDNQRTNRCFWDCLAPNGLENVDSYFVSLDNCRNFEPHALAELIRAKYPQGCHVITDGNLGTSNSQGAELIKLLRISSEFAKMRGIVFTGAQKENAVALKGVKGCVAVSVPESQDKRVKLLTEIICALIEGRDIPNDEEVVQTAITHSIHALNNLPVRLDAGTAYELSIISEPLTGDYLNDCTDMWKATLGGSNPKILVDVRALVKREDEAKRTVDTYLNDGGSTFSLSKMVDSEFKAVVLDVKAGFVGAFGEPGGELFKGWDATAPARDLAALKANDLRHNADQNVTARIALAWALGRVTGALDSVLIVPLRMIREDMMLAD